MDAAEPVAIQAILLSDLVIREAHSNKLSLIGVFNHWNSAGFPFTTAPFWVTVFITNFGPNTSEANITIRFEEPDSGHVIASAKGYVKFKEGAVQKDTMVELPFRINALGLRQQGTYRIVLLANDEKIGERKFSAYPLTITGQQLT